MKAFYSTFPAPTPPKGGFNSHLEICIKAPFRGFGGMAITIILLSLATTTSAQTWQWARAAAGNSTGSVVCSDAAGNVYTAGYFVGGLSFGSDSITDSIGPYQEVFIAKYDAQGNLLWVRNSKGYADAEGISADADGNVYIVGNFYNDSVSFGAATLINPNPGAQNSNIYFTKYDSLGNVIWAKNLGGINNDLAAGVATDASGYVYVTGSFMGDSLTFGTVTAPHIGSSDGFVAKFTSAGNAIWIRNIGGPVSVGPTAICTDAIGSVIMTGYFQYNYMYVGSLSDLISSPYSYNIFITKFDSSGLNMWTSYAGNNYSVSSTGIASDSSGNIYMTGYYVDSIVFGSDTLASIVYQNIFTVQYNASGAVMWARTAGGSNQDQSNGISTDPAGNTYVTGYFNSDTSFFGSAYLTNTIGDQITFVTKYDPSGNVLWAIAPSGTANNWGTGISYSHSTVYISGNFQGAAIAFGSDTLLTSQQGFFLAKLDTASILTGIAPIGPIDSKVSVYPNPSTGTFYFIGLGQEATVVLYNMLGQNIMPSVSLHNGVGMVDLSTYDRGIYFYSILEHGTVVQTGKLLSE